MKLYKVNIAGVEMILPTESLDYIKERNWEYKEIEGKEATHSIDDFKHKSLEIILKDYIEHNSN